ncbi:MAG: GNAT family N-acetyltransferase [Pseudolabrys sp.]|nr:GNAT family N-acetyltransferase [Pseudolabrys sp.]
MANGVTIRAATAADIGAVLALYGQPDLDNGNVLPLTKAQEVFARFARYPDYTLYVAERDGQIVGTFALLFMDNLGHLGAPSGIVEDVAVDPSHHGGGIGGAMMRFAMEKAREQGCYKLVLSSNQKRERAHAFYESLGFTRHGYSFRVEFEQVPA